MNSEIQEESELFSEFEIIEPDIAGQSDNKLIKQIEDKLNVGDFQQYLPSLDVDLNLCHSREEFVVLPLYSMARGKNVPERSGLNQWNARGRSRHPDEVYIPIPMAVHKKNPSFFPERDDPFDLVLPNGEVLCAKVCQQGRKALMSDPNRALGNWILRDLLNLQKYELLTLTQLIKAGFDSVKVAKIGELFYLYPNIPL
ncbi:hypothetical protein VHA01S_016_00290 [Vibrio halioticoli NBRC 102217]|uniref:Restriction endonuclease type II NgoFVII C-terminal B3-like DNA-binding domain-containing protein n=1 Tax=Vibrio halioticoli NBRC 102217 TaxID=1219072 RepID=V5FJP7_9VIBR|nr:hypothetical protein VHA01S_016_00290 [Vibrio halioticoli NBRC 102217]